MRAVLREQLWIGRKERRMRKEPVGAGMVRRNFLAAQCRDRRPAPRPVASPRRIPCGGNRARSRAWRCRGSDAWRVRVRAASARHTAASSRSLQRRCAAGRHIQPTIPADRTSSMAPSGAAYLTGATRARASRRRRRAPRPWVYPHRCHACRGCRPRATHASRRGRQRCPGSTRVTASSVMRDPVCAATDPVPCQRAAAPCAARRKRRHRACVPARCTR